MGLTGQGGENFLRGSLKKVSGGILRILIPLLIKLDCTLLAIVALTTTLWGIWGDGSSTKAANEQLATGTANGSLGE
jgi:hypothetical protein